MASFNCLYFFSAYDLHLIEIKRTDLNADAPLSDIYKWMVVNEKLEEVTEFTFKSMKKEGEQEFRSFNQGELNFDQTSASLEWQGKKFEFKKVMNQTMSTKLKELISKHLDYLQR